MKTISLLLTLTFSAALGAADFSDLVDSSLTVRKIADGFRFTEGPADNGRGRLLFSDIPNERIVELLADGTTRDFFKPSGRANGLAFDLDGMLYACQGGARQVVRIDPASMKVTPLVTSYDGKKLNGPNDLALDGHGGLYFTDPYYGREPDSLEQDVMGVYYIDASGTTTRVIDSLVRPNGILVSPDGTRLYVAEPNRLELYMFTIDAPGKISDKKLIFKGDGELDARGPDGMAHDVHGNIYATYKSVVALDPQGAVIGRIPVPEHPANCTFGGPERKTLYVTARKGLYAIDMKVAGAKLRSGVGKSGARPETKTVAARSLRLEVPKTWKEQKPTNRMRAAQLSIPATAGDPRDATLIVYYFGAGGAGTVKANIDRWVGQFSAEGRSAKTTRGESKLGAYTLVDVEGTYNESIGPPIRRKTEARPNSMMVAAIVEARDGAYYLKLTGPKKTVSTARSALLRSFGAKEAR